MKRLWQLSVITLILFGFATSVIAATTNEIYFNQEGQETEDMVSVAYVRQYTLQNGIAKAQDFYFPSMTKYSDPYEVKESEIHSFVPILDNGTLTLWHFNGVKKMEGHYRKGLPDGEWINWYPNGRKSAVMPYILGKSEGTGQRFYRNGHKESEIQFKNDKANGYWRQWYSDGSPKTEMMMKNDKVVSIVSWNEEGRLLSEMTINEQCLRNGVILEWYDDGAKKSESVYQNDALIKKSMWDEDGYLIEE